jgi:hypothetical protein
VRGSITTMAPEISGNWRSRNWPYCSLSGST